MRFKLLLVSGLFGVGILLLPFSYTSFTYQSEMSSDAGLSVSVAEAQSEVSETWSLRGLWNSVMRQVGGVLDIAAQAIGAVADAPGQLFDITSNNPPDSQADVQASDPFVNGSSQLPFLPVPQIYDGTLIMNVPLQVNSSLSVGGITRLNDLLVSGIFEINDLTVPGVGTFGNIVSGGTQLGALSVAGNTQLNTLSVAGPVTFANVTATNLTSSNISASNLTVSNVLVAQGGITTGGADINLEGGSIFAANVINQLIAGDNIEIGGTANAPIITADVPRITLGSRVRNLNGVSGTLALVGGSDIIVSVAGSDITLTNTSDLSTVAARGGCTDCILDADVVDALTINGGTIDGTVIGSTTPAQAFFTTITVTDTATSTFGGPINVTSGCVSVNGVCLGIGAVNLDDLLDVSIAGAVDGDFLRYNGAAWANASSGALGIGDGSYLGLSDTPDAYIASALMFVNGAGNALTQSAGLTFDGARMAIGSSSAITTLTVDGDISIVDQQALRFYETDNTNYVGFRASTTLGSNVVWTLPIGDGAADQILVTDGSGNLRFSDVSAVGGGAETFLGLDDTPGAYVAGALSYAASTSDRLLFSSSLVFDGTNFGIGSSSPTSKLTVQGSLYVGADANTPGIVYNNVTDTVGIGVRVPAEKLHVEGGTILQRGGSSTAPYLPEFVDSLNLDGGANEIEVVGSRAYVVTGSTVSSLVIIDISDRRNTSILGFENLPAGANDVAVAGSYAYVVTDITGDDFHVVDVSDPTNPTEVASLNLGTSANSVKVRGRYAYVTTNNAVGPDFYIIDIQNPLAPRIVSSMSLRADGNDVALKGDHAFVVTDTDNSIRTIDISDPLVPTNVGTTTMVGDPVAIQIRGDYAFVATASVGDDFHVFSIADPTNVSSISSLALSSGANDVSVSGSYAYVVTAGSDDDLHVIDISDLYNPIEVGSTEMATGAVFGIQVVGRYAYMASAAASDDFDVYDVTGVEAQSVLAHSLESGNLSVLGDIVAAGELDLSEGMRVGNGGIQTSGSLLVQGSDTSLFTGSLAIATTTTDYQLAVGGDAIVYGQLFDSSINAGSLGEIFVSNGSGQVWTATSSLGLSPTFTSSADLAALISDETGTAGSFVLSVSPTLTGTVQVSALSASAALTLSGTAANISLGSNFLSGDGDDEGIYVDGSGFVGIGTTTPVSELSVEGTIMASNLYGVMTSLSTDAQGNIIRTPSDETLKQNIRTIDGALETVLALRGVRYEWIDASRFGDKTEVGFIAQEVDLILPEVVSKGGEYWSLNTPNIVAVLVEAIKELWEVVSGNQEKIELLETRVEYLETLMDVEPPAPSSDNSEDTTDESEDDDGLSEPADDDASNDETGTATDISAPPDNVSADETANQAAGENGEENEAETDVPGNPEENEESASGTEPEGDAAESEGGQSETPTEM